MFNDTPSAVIMELDEDRIKALRWLLKASLQNESDERYEKLRCICVRDDDIVAADGWRMHMLAATSFLLGGNAKNLNDGVYRVIFADDAKTVVFVPQDIKYPQYMAVTNAAEEADPSFVSMNARYLLDAIAGMDTANLYMHQKPAPSMIVGSVGGFHATAYIMPMSTEVVR